MQSGDLASVPLERLCIVGAGLIGGSIALAARQRWPKLQIVAVDRRESLEHIARFLPVVRGVDVDDLGSRATAFAEAELVVLATPVRAIEALLPDALAGGGAVTDCGSTKRSIARVAASTGSSGRFVPGHPMAGKPWGGVEAADALLFHCRSWILCPEASDPEAVSLVSRFTAELGAVPALMTAEEHDRAVALTSHLPQVVASFLVALASERNTPAAAFGPGFLSTTRIAGGGRAMWEDVFLTNADSVAAAARELSKQFEALADELEREPPKLDAVLDLLERARCARAALPPIEE